MAGLAFISGLSGLSCHRGGSVIMMYVCIIELSGLCSSLISLKVSCMFQLSEVVQPADCLESAALATVVSLMAFLFDMVLFGV